MREFLKIYLKFSINLINVLFDPVIVLLGFFFEEIILFFFLFGGQSCGTLYIKLFYPELLRTVKPREKT